MSLSTLSVSGHMNESDYLVFGLSAADSSVLRWWRIWSMLDNRAEIATDLVIMAVGVRSNIELARSAGVTLGQTGTIAVDQTMRTNLPDVWELSY